MNSLCKKDKLVYVAYLDDSCEENTHQIIGAAIIQDREFLDIEGFLGYVVQTDVPEEVRESFEYHASAMYHGKPPFDKLNRETSLSLLESVAAMVAGVPIPIVYGAVDLRRLRGGIYATAQPIDIAFRLCLPEIERWIAINAPEELGIIIADDSRNKNQKENLQKAFRASRKLVFKNPEISTEEDRGALPHLHDDMYFGTSQYSRGIQVADVCCFIINRHLQGKEDTEYLYKMIESEIFSAKIEPSIVGYTNDATEKSATAQGASGKNAGDHS